MGVGWVEFKNHGHNWGSLSLLELEKVDQILLFPLTYLVMCPPLIVPHSELEREDEDEARDMRIRGIGLHMETLLLCPSFYKPECCWWNKREDK